MDRLEAKLIEDIVYDLLHSNSAKVGSGRWLPDHRVPTDKGDSCVPASDGDWEVEGCDTTNKA